MRTRAPRAEVRDLTPILDDMRSVKSPREIALIRRASQLAGLGILEAIKSTKAGLYEYQLDAAARYIFLAGGARLPVVAQLAGTALLVLVKRLVSAGIRRATAARSGSSSGSGPGGGPARPGRAAS